MGLQWGGKKCCFFCQMIECLDVRKDFEWKVKAVINGTSCDNM